MRTGGHDGLGLENLTERIHQRPFQTVHACGIGLDHQKIAKTVHDDTRNRIVERTDHIEHGTRYVAVSNEEASR